jgi:hypothetical protein
VMEEPSFQRENACDSLGGGARVLAAHLSVESANHSAARNRCVID